MSQDLKERLPQPGTAVERAAPADQRPASPAQIVRQAIERQSESFKAVMPRGVDAERFSRLVLTAVKATPQLMECFSTVQGQTTVLLAAMQAASVGLEPNTPTQDCWLLPRRNKGTMECQLSIGYRGLLKLARRSGTIKTIYAEVVHEKDQFTWSRGLEDDHLEHIPFDGDGEAGALTHAYAVARYVNGGYSFIVLNRRQVETRRAQSDSWRNENARAYSPWSKWPEEMWRKTAVRALVPYLELSTEAAQTVAADETRLVFRDEDGVIDVDSEQQPELDAVPSEGEQRVAVPPESPQTAPAGDELPSDGPPFEAATSAQMKALHALLKRKMGVDGDERHPAVSRLLDREISSMNEVSKTEAGELIDMLQQEPDPEPQP